MKRDTYDKFDAISDMVLCGLRHASVYYFPPRGVLLLLLLLPPTPLRNVTDMKRLARYKADIKVHLRRIYACKFFKLFKGL